MKRTELLQKGQIERLGIWHPFRDDETAQQDFELSATSFIAVMYAIDILIIL